MFTAIAVVPLAVVAAAFFETPRVVELPPGPIVGRQSRPPADPVVANDMDVHLPERMGSGKMFDRIAWAYDFTNRWMSFGLDRQWREHLVRECVRPAKGDNVLDLAAGTADVSISIGFRLMRLGGEGKVLGVDPSKEMLCRGLSKVVSEGLDNRIRLAGGDAQNLSAIRTVTKLHGLSRECRLAKAEAGTSVKDGTVDKVSMAFGIRNVPDRVAALREIRRVLRDTPSSRACILEFSMPEGPGWGASLARKFIERVLPMIGWAATLGKGGNEYMYLTESIADFPNSLEFAAIMADAGLQVSNITHLAFGAVQLYTAVPDVRE